MIYTFYSYKGGVGRSMAMANVAEILYRRGLKVLMVDFDLEAPGLEHYFAAEEVAHFPDEIERKRGLIDLLVSYNSLRILLRPNPAYVAGESAPATVTGGQSADTGTLGGSVSSMPFPVEPLTNFIWPVYKKAENGGELHIMPAGRRAKEISNDGHPSAPPETAERRDADFARYAESVRSFPWSDFYDKWDGQIFFDWFREQAAKFADVVLIDSRTGVTEMSGVCTYHLADVVVMFCAPNKQNLSGTKRIADSLISPRLAAEGRKGRELPIIVVPSRVDVSEKVEVDGFAKDFQNTFLDLTPDELTFETSLFSDLRIPYIPFYSFREEVAARDTNSFIAQEFVKVYEKISLTLAKLEPETGSRLRAAFERELSDKGNLAELQNRLAEKAFGRLTPEEQETAHAVFIRLVRLAKSEEAGGAARLRVKMGELPATAPKVVKIFSEHDLVKTETDDSGETTVQIAEDSFVWNWQRLKKWLEEDRDFLLWRQQLQINIEQWNNRKREKTALLSGPLLNEAKSRQERSGQQLNDTENYYISQSARHQTQRTIKNFIIILFLVLLTGLGVYWLTQADLKDREAKLKAQEKARLELANSFLNSGETNLKNNNPKSAVQSYTSAIETKDDLVAAYIGRGRAYSALDERQLAFDDFSEAIKRDAGNADAYYNRGLIRFRNGDVSRAMNDFTVAISFNPNFSAAYYERGNVQFTMNNLDGAASDFTRPIELSGDAEAYFRRGRVYQLKYKNERSPELKEMAIADFNAAISKTSIPVTRSAAELALKDLGAAGQTVNPQPRKPTIYILFNNLGDRELVNDITNDIRSSGEDFNLAGVQRADAPTDGDVRYFYREDGANAEKLRKLVAESLARRGINLPIKLRFLGGYDEKVERGNIEMWLPTLNPKLDPQQYPVR